MDAKIIQQHHDDCEEKKASLLAKGFKGEWNEEPNHVQWKHAGFDCLLVRGPTLAWCGYVGLPMDHPLYGKSWSEIYGNEWAEKHSPDYSPRLADLDIHGGLTYAAGCSGPICHTPENKPDAVWWLGFDCSHLGDLSPSLSIYRFENPLKFPALIMEWEKDRYRNQDYARKQTKYLAEQLSVIQLSVIQMKRDE